MVFISESFGQTVLRAISGILRHLWMSSRVGSGSVLRESPSLESHRHDCPSCRVKCWLGRAPCPRSEPAFGDRSGRGAARCSWRGGSSRLRRSSQGCQLSQARSSSHHPGGLALRLTWPLAPHGVLRTATATFLRIQGRTRGLLLPAASAGLAFGGRTGRGYVRQSEPDEWQGSRLALDAWSAV